MLPPFLLAHLSDPHLPTPARTGGAALKQRLARAAWGRKRDVHRPEMLAAVVEDIRGQYPDHIVVTGDLVNLAAPAEFAAARAWLTTFADPHRLTVVPGNHDALVPAGSAQWVAWAAWMEDTPGVFPKLRVRDGVALVGASSAVVTPPGSARGRLGGEQLARLEAVLTRARAEGLVRVVLLHHAPAPGAAPWRKALADAPALACVLRRAGAELMLHGHLHRATLGALPGPHGPIPVVGAPSAASSLAGERAARWHLIAIAPCAGGVEIRVTVRGRRPDGAMGTLGGYVLAPPQGRGGASQVPRPA